MNECLCQQLKCRHLYHDENVWPSCYRCRIVKNLCDDDLYLTSNGTDLFARTEEGNYIHQLARDFDRRCIHAKKFKLIYKLKKV